MIREGDLVIGLLHTQNGSFAISDKDYASTGTFVPFEIDEVRIKKDYLFYLLKLTFVKLGINDATGRENYKVEDVLSLQIPLPPLEIQNEIVEKIEKQKQIIEGAEKILKEWQPIISESLVKRPLKDFIIDSLYGISAPLNEDGKYPVLRMNNLDTQGNWYVGDLKYIDDEIKEERKLKIGDFIFNRTNSKELVGKSGVINFKFDGTWAGYLIRLRFNKDLSPYYLRYLFAQQKYRNYFSSIGKQAGGQANINADELAQTIIDWYPFETQRQIVERLDRQMSALESVRFLKAEAEKRIEEILSGVWGEKPVEETHSVTQNETVQYENTVEEKAFLKRKILATYIINQSLNDPHFGDVKFEKLFFLSEYFVVKRNFEQKYYVQAAGPYDNRFTIDFFNQIEKSKWFNRQKKGNQYIFSKGEKHDKSLNTYSLFSDNELERVNTLINYFKKSDYEQPEIIATLYAVWNNRIIKQEPITDELLKEDFLHWDTQKIKYKDRLDGALKWMREHNFVPDGWGAVIEKTWRKTKKKHI